VWMERDSKKEKRLRREQIEVKLEPVWFPSKDLSRLELFSFLKDLSLFGSTSCQLAYQNAFDLSMHRSKPLMFHLPTPTRHQQLLDGSRLVSLSFQ
jgi:hypothetical protein